MPFFGIFPTLQLLELFHPSSVVLGTLDLTPILLPLPFKCWDYWRVALSRFHSCILSFKFHWIKIIYFFSFLDFLIFVFSFDISWIFGLSFIVFWDVCFVTSNLHICITPNKDILVPGHIYIHIKLFIFRIYTLSVGSLFDGIWQMFL